MPIQFQQITLDGSQTNRAVASWSRGQGGFTASFEARYRIGSGNFVDFSTTNTSLNINGIDPGQILEVQVRGVGISFPVKKSIYAIAKAEAPSIDADQISSIGVTSSAPQDIQDLSIQPLTNTTGVLRWNFPTGGVDLKNLNVDIRHPELSHRIRHYKNNPDNSLEMAAMLYLRACFQLKVLAACLGY